MKNVILGITGSIAAYKAADIANALVKGGIGVDVILTKGGAEFITPLTMQTLTKRRVSTDVFQEIVADEVRHISLSQKADLFIVAPASADIIAKLAHGIADDMLTSVALALPPIPKLIAPAMNTRMWEHPAVRENIAALRGMAIRSSSRGKRGSHAAISGKARSPTSRLSSPRSWPRSGNAHDRSDDQ